MLGVVLAGGSATRLAPISLAISKQLLPVFDKPLIYYPIATLAEAGIREILLIVREDDQSAFRRLLGDGGQWGMRISYATQASPKGIADAIRLTEDSGNSGPITLVLGDNLFHGSRALVDAVRDTPPSGATVFAYQVGNPEAYGVITFDHAGCPISIVEKPSRPESHWAVTGLYMYDESVYEIARNLRPSERGELEITDVNRHFLELGSLQVIQLPQGSAWMDTGSPRGLHDAAEYVRVIQERQGTKVGCIEEIAWRNGWVSDRELLKLAEPLMASGYGKHLVGLVGDS